MIGSPVIIEHQDVTDKNADKIRCGVISDAYFNEPDGWYYAEGIIWDDKAISLINDGWSVSCSYDFLAFNDEGGEENNIKYDKEFTELNFTHLAIVNNPRYERANIVFNSKVKSTEVNNEDKWITIHPNGEDAKGRPLLLKDGETPREALARAYGVDEAKGQQKLFPTKEFKKTREDFQREEQEQKDIFAQHQKKLETKYRNMEFAGTENPDELQDLSGEDVDFEEWEYKKQSDIKDNEAVKRGLDEETVKKQIEKLKKGKEYRINKSARLTFTGDFDNEGMPIFQNDKGYKQGYSLTNYFEEINEEQSKDKQEPEWLQREKQKLDRQTTQMYEDRYATEHPETYKKNLEKTKNKQSGTTDKQETNFEKYAFNKENFQKAIKQSDIKSIEKSIKDLRTRFDWAFGTDKKQQVIKDLDVLYDTLSEASTNEISEDEFENLVSQISEVDKYISDIMTKDYTKEDKSTKAKYLGVKKSKTNNSKEKDMTLLDELKKLIFKVENEKENKMDSKSKILSILNEKEVDKETIEEIKNEIEKMEEEKEEVKNKKKVKNEEEEIEEKEEEKEVDNEEEEDDEEKVEELKKEEKKDVENKCKNSKETSTFDKINAIYNSVRALKPQIKYTSRQEKLDNAVEYFKN